MNQKSIDVNNIQFAAIASDVALFTLHDDVLLVRIIPVTRPPYYPNNQGLPGGLIRPEETAEEAAQRLLREKASITSPTIYLEQLATFSRIDRDPRNRVVAVAYIGLVPWNELTAYEQSAGTSYWADAKKQHDLAYDHDEMLAVARTRLASRVSYTTLIQKLMPSEFTLTELERAYGVVTGRRIDKRNFRKKIIKLGILKPLDRMRRGIQARPAQLYTFAQPKVIDIEAL